MNYKKIILFISTMCLISQSNAGLTSKVTNLASKRTTFFEKCCDKIANATVVLKKILYATGFLILGYTCILVSALAVVYFIAYPTFALTLIPVAAFACCSGIGAEILLKECIYAD